MLVNDQSKQTVSLYPNVWICPKKDEYMRQENSYGAILFTTQEFLGRKNIYGLRNFTAQEYLRHNNV